jgi:membrane peptidoglycan carboxypeptidase
MKVSVLRRLSTREWLIAAGGAVVIVCLTAFLVWTGRYGWAVYKLNRGVGDTVFYDGLGKPWFRLDEQRQDVPLEKISRYLTDAVIAVEDHRFYLHPGIDPIGLTRAVFKAGAHSRSSLPARCSCRTSEATAVSSRRPSSPSCSKCCCGNTRSSSCT